MFLFLDMPVYDFPLVYDERKYLNPFPVCTYANGASSAAPNSPFNESFP